MTTEKIVQMIQDLLMGPFFDIGKGIWTFIMSLVCGVVTTTPQGFSQTAWDWVSGQLYPWSLAIGLTLLNLFFLAGFFRQTANIKENMTTEILVTLLVKLVTANVLMSEGLEIMNAFFEMSSLLCGQVFIEMPSYAAVDISCGTWVFFHGIYSIIYMIVAAVTSMTIFLAVYGRYLKLYLAVVAEPVAMATLAGGMGLENTAHAWIKTFLAYTFEILLIVLAISISGKLIECINWGTLDGIVGSLFNGAAASIRSMFSMVLMAGSVKGTDSLMRRMFAL